MRNGYPRWALATAIALATLLGLPGGLALHDVFGRVIPGPSLPVVLVRVTGDPAVAVARARAAGASDVWAALDAGDPRLGGAQPDPGWLEEGRDGRLRLAQGRLLPLPEALPALVEVADSQLGDGTPPTTLEGRSAVLVWADPATGRRVLLPGVDGPADRGVALAVALGAAAAGATRSVLPPLAATGLVLLVAVAQAAAVARRMPGQAVGFAAIQLLVVVLIVWINRWLGVDLPVGGLLAAVILPTLVRIGEVAAGALDVLDRMVVWLGPPPQDAPAAVGVAATGAMLAVWLPAAKVAAWRAGGEGRLDPAGEWGDGPPIPAPAALPSTEGEAGDARLLPVLDRGEVVGVVAVRFPGGDAAAWALARAVVGAGGHGAGAVEAAPGSDPLAVRVALARVAVRRALTRAERWEDLLRRAGSVVGMFDLAGSLVSGSTTLQAAVSDPDRPALLQALAAFGPGDADAELRAVRDVVGGDRAVRLPGRDGGELALLPVHAGGGASGVLLVRLDAPALAGGGA